MTSLHTSFNATTSTPSSEEVSAFVMAADQGDITKVCAIIDTFGDTIVNAKSDARNTALIRAAWNGHADVVTLLLRRGAKVDVRDGDGDSALILAAWNGHADIVKHLLENDADIEAKNYAGSTALIWAARKGRADCVTLLLKWGANIEVESDDGVTPLLAATWNQQTIIESILRQWPERQAHTLVAEMTRDGIQQEIKVPTRLVLRSPTQMRKI